ncbi:MAG: type II secretion system F family protein [Candidatus Diapherotrites archaeon]|nr:type II secretion system F family protein [Candidatus Diapherotrites archaeon]
MSIDNIIERYFAGRKAKEIEAQLVFFLMALRLNLLSGLSLESSLKKVKSEVSGALAKELAKIEKELGKGKDIGEALLNSASRIESLEFKRALSHISEVARSGYSRKSDTLKLLCDELIELRKTKMREFSSKLAVLSLMFIAASVIMPALWLAFVIMGSAFFALDISALQIWLSVTVIFPTIAVLLLLYIKEKFP